MSENNSEIKPHTQSLSQTNKEAGKEQPKRELGAHEIMVAALKTADLNAAKIFDEKMKNREGLADPDTRTEILLDPQVLDAVKHTRIVSSACDLVDSYVLYGGGQDDRLFQLSDTDTGFEKEPDNEETKSEQKARTVRNLKKRLNKIALEVSRNMGDISSIEGIDNVDAIQFAIIALSPMEEDKTAGRQDASSPQA